MTIGVHQNISVGEHFPLRPLALTNGPTIILFVNNFYEIYY